MKSLNVLLINPKNGYLQDMLDWMKSNTPHVSIDTMIFKQLFSAAILSKLQLLMQVPYTLLQAARLVLFPSQYGVILLNGNLIAPPILLLRRLFGMNLRKTKIIVMHFFLNDIRNYALVKSLVRFLFDQHDVTMIALSKGDQEHYAGLFKRTKVVYYPLCFYDSPDTKDELVKNEEEGAYVFAGGWTNRDYESLMSAARRVSIPFLVVCSDKNVLPAIPENIKVVRDVPNAVFNQYVRDSRFVVVPLKENVGAAGQMVALTAMMYGKAVIYTDLPCISDYLEDLRSGLAYRPGNDAELAEKIQLLIDDPSLAKTLGKAAAERFDSLFRPEKFYIFLTDIISNCCSNSIET